MSVIDGNEDDRSGDRKNKKHTHEVFARAEKCSNARFYYYIYPWLHAHRCSPRRDSRRSSGRGVRGGGRSSSFRAAACRSPPSSDSEDGHSRRAAAEAEDARVVEAAARRSSAVRGMAWRMDGRLWWITGFWTATCSSPNLHDSTALCDWLYRGERRQLLHLQI